MTVSVASAQTPPPSPAQPHIALFAAGSLRGALTDIVAAFSAQTNIAVDVTYGSSGLLRGRIENGEPADVFASADLDSPQRLQAAGKSGPVSVFVRNRMCLLVKTAVAGTRGPAEIVLDPAVRLITSTPKADPSGDYAEVVFGKIDAAKPGSLAALDAKSLRLIGGTDAVPIPAGADLATYLLITANRGDALLAYCSGFLPPVKANAGLLRSLEMPAALAVRADYGITIRTGAPAPAARLRDFILSAPAQTIFETYGFSRV